MKRPAIDDCPHNPVRKLTKSFMLKIVDVEKGETNIGVEVLVVLPNIPTAIIFNKCVSGVNRNVVPHYRSEGADSRGTGNIVLFCESWKQELGLLSVTSGIRRRDRMEQDSHYLPHYVDSQT
jgi:hypothetical protein